MKIRFRTLISFITIFSSVLACKHTPEVTVDRLTCNFREHPVGVDSAPLLGWQLKSSGSNVIQTAYRIIVAENPNELENG
ncbi:MAG: hypothetical protein JW761_11565, partial [Prolixibacteraceae bacterium]|nr:hypothetical protein [Prolixibacteraceae bacterium]